MLLGFVKSVLWGTKWDVTRNRKTNYLESGGARG